MLRISWACIASRKKEEAIYSRVFESTKAEQKYCRRGVGGDWLSGPTHFQFVTYNLYSHQRMQLVAKPIQDDAENRYRIYLHYDYKYSNNADTGGYPALKNPKPNGGDVPVKGIYTRAQVLEAIKNREEAWRKEAKLPLQKQPKTYRKQPLLSQNTM